MTLLLGVAALTSLCCHPDSVLIREAFSRRRELSPGPGDPGCDAIITTVSNVIRYQQTNISHFPGGVIYT
jgi:hypothetical protein